MTTYPAPADPPGIDRDPELDGLLAALPQQVQGVSVVVAASGDGITRATFRVHRDVGDALGAAASGIAGLIKGLSAHLNAGTAHHVVVDLDAGFLVITRPAEHALLLVLAAKSVDMAQLLYALGRLGESAGRILAPSTRTPVNAPR